MPTYEITAPDGKVYDVEAPEGASEADVMSYAQANYGGKPAEEKGVLKNAAESYALSTYGGGNGLGDNILDVGAGVNKAMMDMVDLPFAMVGMGLNAVNEFAGLEGDDKLQMMLPSEIPAIKDFVKKGTGRFVPEGESTAQDMIRTATEWGSGGVLSKGSKLPDILAGVGAAVGEQLGGDTGEMIGGVTGLLTGNVKRPAGASPDKVEDSTISFIMENAENPEQAMVNLERAIASGEKGNLAELTQDRGIFNVQKSAVVKGSETDWKMQDLAAERNQQIVDDSTQVFGQGDASQALPMAAQQQQRLNTQGKAVTDANLATEVQGIQADPQFESVLPSATGRLNDAQLQADTAAEAIRTPSKPSEASTELSQAIDMGEEAFNENFVKPAWDKFSEGRNLETGEVNGILKEELDKLNITEANILNQKFGSQIGLIRNFGDEVAPSEVHAVVSQIKAINSNARKADDYDNANRLLDRVGGALERSLRELGSKTDYEDAVALTKEKFQRFSPSRVGKERAVGEPNTLGRRLIAAKEAGAESGQSLVKSADPVVLENAENYVKSIAQSDGINQKFLDDYDEFLDSFPELKTELTAAKKAQDDLVAATEGVDAAAKQDEASGKLLAKTIENAQNKAGTRKEGLTKSISNLEVSKFRQSPEKFLDSALQGNPSDLTRLNRQLGRTEGGSEALRAAVRDRFKANIVNGEGVVTPAKVAEFNSSKRALIESGILTKDEVIQIENKLDRVRISGLSKTAGARKTAKADEVISDIVSSTAAVTALQLLPASNQLLLGGTVRRMFKGLYGGNAKHQAKVLSALDSVITNPKKFLEGVKKENITTEKALEEYILRYVNAAAQSVSEDSEDE